MYSGCVKVSLSGFRRRGKWVAMAPGEGICGSQRRVAMVKVVGKVKEEEDNEGENYGSES